MTRGYEVCKHLVFFLKWNSIKKYKLNLEPDVATVSKKSRASKTKVAHRSLHRISGLAVTLPLTLQCRSEQLAANKNYMVKLRLLQ